MADEACRKCHIITSKNLCPKCNTPSLSDDYSGLVIIIDPNESYIAKVMEITEKGQYALRVR